MRTPAQLTSGNENARAGRKCHARRTLGMLAPLGRSPLRGSAPEEDRVAADSNFVAAIPQLRIPPDAPPWLAGARCADCGQVYLVRPVACPKCFSRKEMAEVALAERGKLYSY